MKIHFSFFRLFLFVLSLSLHAEESFLSDGLTYEHVVTEVPQSIHILRVDPTKLAIIPARALDDTLGRESVSSLCTRHGAVAGINAGFFEIGGTFDGLPSGILKIQNEWYFLPTKPRAALGWKNEGQAVLIDRLLASCSVRVGEKTIPIDGLNRPRKPGEKILYSSCFHRTTLTSPEGVEVAIQNNKVQQITSQKGSALLPENGWVLSLANPIDPTISSLFSIDSSVSISLTPLPQGSPSYTTSADWAAMDHIVGGTPVLVQNGKVITDFSTEKTRLPFLTDRYARTAIGILKNKQWIFVVVDGRQPDLSVGMTMNELAEFMVNLGCIEAMNFDGGGSSTMVIGQKIINNPYGDEDEDEGKKSVRRVSDAILILEKKSP